MGSTDKSQNELVVLVTGFGPFKNDYPRNPSWDIAASLPEYLPPFGANSSSSASLPPVRIVRHPEPIRVTYSAVRELVPKLWVPSFSNVPKVDFVLHIGMASSKVQYVLEQLGHRDDYKLGDLDGRLPVQDPNSDDWPWRGVPSQLKTDLDVFDIKDRWEKNLPGNDLPLRISQNAGHFLCDYIYFNSLANCYKSEERRRVAFLHVPAVKAEPALHYREATATGRNITLELIRSIVESELAAAAADAQA